MLALKNADVYYGKAQALHGVSIALPRGAALSLVGRNGAGRSTTLKALMGLLPLNSGVREINSEDTTSLPAHLISRLGVAYVPESRQIFPGLTVHENLLIGTVAHNPVNWPISRIYALFPRLAERRRAYGDHLSGGEQQMLSIGRALVSDPRYLLLDEPTEGLAPAIIAVLEQAITAIIAQGVGVLLVEQRIEIPLRLSNYQHVIDGGRIVWSGTTDQMKADRKRIEGLLIG